MSGNIIKTVNNIGDTLGGIIIYIVLFFFTFGGGYIKFKSYWFLIFGFIMLSIFVYSSLKQLAIVTFYSDKITKHSPLNKRTIVEIPKEQITLWLTGGTYRISSNSIAIWNKDNKIANCQLNSSEWEFEEFYDNTKANNYKWVISDDKVYSQKRNYDLYLKRKKIMERNKILK